MERRDKEKAREKERRIGRATEGRRENANKGIR